LFNIFKNNRKAILDKVEKNEDLNPVEQKILKGEYSIVKSKLWFTRVSVISFLILQVVLVSAIIIKVMGPVGPAGEHVAVLSLDKPINDEYADQFISKMITTSKNANVRAMVIRLRSPGGTPSASWNIATTLKDLQTNGKIPVYVYVDSAAVSGSYMIASQADVIYANRFSVVGSIGVIMEHMVFDGVSKKVGFGEETLTAGKYKKMMSTFSYMSDEDRKYVQETLLNVMYSNFKDVVASGRKMKIEGLDDLADGRVFVSNDKKVQGTLIDKIIDWPDFKRTIIKKQKLSEDIDFFDYKIEETAGLFGGIGTKLDLNLNVSSDLLKSENIK
jgi:protease-4